MDQPCLSILSHYPSKVRLQLAPTRHCRPQTASRHLRTQARSRIPSPPLRPYRRLLAQRNWARDGRSGRHRLLHRPQDPFEESRPLSWEWRRAHWLDLYWLRLPIALILFVVHLGNLQELDGARGPPSARADARAARQDRLRGRGL